MENTYGVGVKNRYELFYDDEEEDPLEILRQQEAENERRKTDKLQKEKVKPGTGKVAKPPPPTKNASVKEPGPRGPGAADAYRPRPKPGVERAPRFEDSRVLEERKNFRNKEDKPSSNPSVESREWRGGDGEIRRGRGGPRGGRGGGRGRGRGAGFGFDNRGKREFDRQSGSDRSVKPFEKREGGGAHNWGTVKDDLDVQLTPFGEDTQEGGERSGDEVHEGAPQLKEGEQAPADEIKEPTEDSFREMTLDEWKKEQKVRRSVPKYNLRKAGEGEDGTQWKKLFLLKKKVGEDDDEEEEEDTDDEDYVRRGRQKTRVDIEINFTDTRGRGRGRGRGGGGRGGGRGGGGGGGGGSGGSAGSGAGVDANDAQHAAKLNKSPVQQSAPKVDDWNDFPSLVAA